LLTVWLLSDIVLLIFMAVLIALMLQGVTYWAARHSGFPQQAMLAPVSVAGIILGLLYCIGPRLN
jgi:predicted PurR-regulated permease PerM